MSLIATLKKGRVFAVDPSTNSLAFSVVEPKKLQAYGKIHLPKGAWQDKFQVISVVLPKLLEFHKPTHFLIEQSIYIQNPNTSRQLAYINGCTLGVVLGSGLSRVSDVPPLTWKPFIGYKNVSKKEKDEWGLTMDQKEVKKKAEFERKERVKRIIDVRIPNHGCTDYDIIDSMGIGLWGLAHVI